MIIFQLYIQTMALAPIKWTRLCWQPAHVIIVIALTMLSCLKFSVKAVPNSLIYMRFMGFNFIWPLQWLTWAWWYLKPTAIRLLVWQLFRLTSKKTPKRIIRRLWDETIGDCLILITKDTPYLTITDELWCVYCECFRKLTVLWMIKLAVL